MNITLFYLYAKAPFEAVTNGTNIIIGSFTFLCPWTDQGVWTPHPVSLMGEAFYIFQARVFQEMKAFQYINTRFHNTDTNKLMIDVQCKYSNIVNNKKNIQHCMLK